MDARKQTLVRAIGTAAIGVIVSLAALNLYRESRPLPEFPSPSGRRVARVLINREPGTTRHNCLVVEVLDGGGNRLFRGHTGASKFSSWRFHWDDDSSLVMDSGDIGPHRWVESDGAWTRQSRGPDGVWKRADYPPEG